MNSYRYILIVGFLISGFLAKAQDPHFTQFYAAPTYLNPAFAGTSTQSRVALNYRHQWPAISGAFVTQNASFDQYFNGINSGVGVMVTHDRAGTGALSFLNVAAQYAYEVHLSRKFSLRPALQVSVTQRSLDYNRLTFGDQLLRDNAHHTLDPDLAQFGNRKVMYPDFGGGLLLFSDAIWFGVSAMHLNRPNQSLIEQESRVPIKYSMHGGWRKRVNKKEYNAPKQYLVTAFHYRAQHNFDQLDIGIYYEYDPITFGVWYRGLPGLKGNDAGYAHHDALALMLGCQIKSIYVGYSYDITISNLAVNTGGSHEISLITEFASRRNKRKSKHRVIPCAKF